ncbi:snRNA-activating protein complex subunit 3-like [Montipora foliosa]|uniref:snRNA-activating protein complex subunit 3-like n=1 Tax=Montipora foliosa TaxID=591990 RepID=UPI0035F11E2B
MATRGECTSSLISVREFKRQFIEFLDPEAYERKRREVVLADMAVEMNVPMEIIADLSEVCSPSNLKCPAETENLESLDIFKEQIPDGVALHSLRLFKERHGQLTSRRKEVNYLVKETLPTKKPQAFEDIKTNEVVLSIGIYHPRKQNKVQEFLVLGSQSLNELRDKIFCTADHMILGDHSDKPDDLDESTAKELCKSGFFFIEGVFYNDRRDPLSRDYSKVIMDWAKDSQRRKIPGLGSLTSKQMDNVMFEDLKIKLGYPYLYCHQGNCEHLMIFTDLRLLHADDELNATEYPLQVFKHRGKRLRCRVCDVYTARWVTVNDSLACEDPCFFCATCFKGLHYTPNGEKICDFQAYPVLGDFDW